MWSVLENDSGGGGVCDTTKKKIRAKYFINPYPVLMVTFGTHMIYSWTQITELKPTPLIFS